MWIVDQVDREPCAAEPVHSSILPATTFGPSPAGQCDDAGSLVGTSRANQKPASSNRSPQTRHEPGSSLRPITTVRSRLLEFFIEAFTAYGRATYPTFADPGELIDHQVPERDSHLRSQIDHVSDSLVLDAIRAADMGQDHDVAGTRRPNAEGHWSPSLPNRKRCEAWESLRMVGLRSSMPVH
jgi:hypothetical protein